MTPPICVVLYTVMHITLFDSKIAPVTMMTALFMIEPLRAHNSSSASHELAAETPWRAASRSSVAQVTRGSQARSIMFL